MVMPAVAPVFPVRMLVTIARPHGFPVAMNRDIAVAVPAPVAAGPDVAGARCRFFFNNAFRRRLRGDDFDILGARRRSAPLMHDPFFDATGGHHQNASQR